MNQTNQANFKFEKGDRVLYAGDESLGIPQDFGTVESIDEEEGTVWVKWDSDDNDLWVYDNEISLIERQNSCLDGSDYSDNQNELTVEKCIEFLSSKGYCITLSKK